MIKRTWWKEATIYEIYPRSFKDSNGDGIGDLPGIIQSLDYLQRLSVDILWLCPIFTSPNDDNGYDISDYYQIMADFGTMADFDELLRGVHDRGMRLILDLVPNHCSDEHFWFQQSRQSKDNPYRDYFHWQPPAPDGGPPDCRPLDRQPLDRQPLDRQPPNNWRSYFGGSAWEYDALTNEYYLHLFTKKQPDLKWENPAVREEIYKIIDFWFEKGIDGFRMDVITLVSKRDGYPATTSTSFTEVAETVYANGPRVHEYLREMNERVLSRYDVVSLGEGVGIKPENANQYVGEERGELNMAYHFDLLHLINTDGRFSETVPLDIIRLKQLVQTWYDAVGESGWIVNTLSNHDYARMVSRFGNDQQYRARSAKLLMTFLSTIRGTLGLYQGDELGMTNVAFDTIDDYRDVETLNFYQEASTGKSAQEKQEILCLIQKEGRDNARTPFQWNDSSQAGFTTGTPWIAVNPNYTDINAAQQENDPDSVLHYYRRMLRLRKEHPTLVYGDYRCLNPDDPLTYQYVRSWEEERYYIVLNMSDGSVAVDAPVQPLPPVLINNESVLTVEDKKLILQPYQAVIFAELSR